DRLDPKVARRLSNTPPGQNPVTVRVTGSAHDDLPTSEIDNVGLRGHETNRTEENSPGFFNPITRVAFIPILSRDPVNDLWTRASIEHFRRTIAEELGHALNVQTPGVTISETPSFVNAIQKDWDKLTEDQAKKLAYFLNRGEFKAAPSIGRQETVEAARDEVFAVLLAAHQGYKIGEFTANEFKKIFEHSYEEFKRYLASLP
ncbi:MAG: hypothetical protein K2X81_11475, partial [Candidatus Obscuribacterales bacterium]|nr:hypothetical protein [Candidatus Obscuribacterales bacterium]